MIKSLSKALMAALHILYAVYAWIVFLLSISLAILFALLLPGLERRRRWVGAAARLFFRLAFIRAEVRGMQRLPKSPCIVVANHASYLDGMILQAFLPPRFAFVIKGEAQQVPVLHFALRRIGSKFVERFVTQASSRDARNLVKAAASGESLGLFPEGTFSGDVGLARFRQGAFVAAMRAEISLVPVAIRGSRDILPAGTLLPRPGTLIIEVLQPILPGSPEFASAAELSNTARSRILECLGEPDLSDVGHYVP